MTVKLLVDFGKFPPNTIVTLDAGTEAGLVAAGLADLNLAGGVQYTPPVPAPQRVPLLAEVDGSGNTTGIIRPDGQPITMGGGGRPGNRLGLLGDSITAFGGLGINATSTTVGNLVTAVAPNHGLTVGQSFIFHLSAASPLYNGVWRVNSVIDKDTLTFYTKAAPGVPAGAGTVLIPFRSAASTAWWQWMNIELGGAFDIVVNAAIGGNTTSMMLERLDSDVIAYRLDYCTILAGTNDIRYGLTVAARDAAFANIKTICQRLLAANITPILCTVLPVGAADPNFAITMPLLLSLNDMIRAFAVQTRGIILADTFAELVDNTQTDNRALQTGLQDTVHINAIGACRVGRGAGRAVAKYAPQPRPMIGSNADSYDVSTSSSNRLKNPLFVRSGGTVNAGNQGVVAEGWSLDRTGAASAVASLVPRTLADDGDRCGNNQVIVMTSTADGETITFRSGAPATSVVNAEGKELYADFVVKLSDAAAVKYLVVDLAVTIGGVTHHCYSSSGSGNGFPNSEMPLAGVIRTLSFKLPPGAPTSITVQASAGFSGAGGLKMVMGRPRIGEKTDLL